MSRRQFGMALRRASCKFCVTANSDLYDFVFAFAVVVNAPDSLGWMDRGKEFETQQAASFGNRCKSCKANAGSLIMLKLTLCGRPCT